MKRTLAAIALGSLCLSILLISSARLTPYSYASDPTFPWVGVPVRLVPNGSFQYVSCSDYVYVAHGWVQINWSSVPSAAQTAFLDPTQSNFTLATNITDNENPTLTQFTYYNSTADTMSSFFWIQFLPGALAPAAYQFTGTWQEDAAANYPNNTAIYGQNVITLVVNPANSTTAVSLSPNPVLIASNTNCTATVSGLDATGTIVFTTSSSTGSFSPANGELSSGSFTTTYVDNNTGYVTITATYSGDSYNGPSSGSATLTVFMNVATGTNVTVTPTNNLGLTFDNVTGAGIVVANATPTVPAPPLDLVGEFYDVKVTATFVGNVTVSLAFDGSNMTQQQKSVLKMMQYTPIPGDFKGAGVVNILDAIILGNAFLSHGPNHDYLGEPASPNWNPSADLNGDGIVNILDAIILGNHFLQTANWVNITSNVDTTNNIVYGQTTHFSFITIH